jgi:hypothetical protein
VFTSPHPTPTCAQLFELLLSIVGVPSFKAQVQAGLGDMVYVAVAFMQMSQVGGACAMRLCGCAVQWCVMVSHAGGVVGGLCQLQGPWRVCTCSLHSTNAHPRLKNTHTHTTAGPGRVVGAQRRPVCG